MKKTALYKEHINLNAKMVDFADHMMPVNYSNGIQFEYNSIRNGNGMFDVSHMGQIVVEGEESLQLLQFCLINDLKNIKIGEAQYSAICNEEGGIKDDIIVYCNKKNYMLIVNASNCKKIFNWIKYNNNWSCKVTNISNEFSLLAVQGPLSRKTLKKLFKKDIDLNFYNHKTIEYNQEHIFISRTGYTGELGYEILVNSTTAIKIWRGLIKLGVTPCGLAVRDILRIEMKYCLYGNDINEDITPIEAGLNWIVKFSKEFIGKKKLLNQKKNGISKKIIGFKMVDKCIPRHGYKLYSGKKEIGFVTSGTFSIGLKLGIGMAYVESKFQDKDIFLSIRGKRKKGRVVNSSFITETSLHD